MNPFLACLFAFKYAFLLVMGYLIFTALGNLNFSISVNQPMQTLSLQIYVYATGPFDEWHRLAWASALVLMGLVLIISIVARWVTRARYGSAR